MKFPAQAVDLTGEKFNSLLVLRRDGMTPGGHATWLCLCDCGATTVAQGKRLRNDATKSCGCRMREGGGSRRRDEPISYASAHKRLYRDLGRAAAHRCVDCQCPAHEWSYLGGDPAELIGRNGKADCAYSLNPAFYVARCRSCHRRADAQLPTVA